MRDVVEMVKLRIEDPEKLEELDSMLGGVFDRIQLEMTQRHEHSSDEFMF